MIFEILITRQGIHCKTIDIWAFHLEQTTAESHTQFAEFHSQHTTHLFTKNSWTISTTTPCNKSNKWYFRFQHFDFDFPNKILHKSSWNRNEPTNRRSTRHLKKKLKSKWWRAIHGYHKSFDARPYLGITDKTIYIERKCQNLNKASILIETASCRCSDMMAWHVFGC